MFQRAISISLLVLMIITCKLLPWEFEIIDTAGVMGTSVSLNIDNEGNPHVGYSASTFPEIDWKVLYAYKINSNWSIQEVDSSGSSGGLGIDGYNNPHISYHDFNYPLRRLWYAVWDDVSWDREIVDETDGALNTSLSVDSRGYAHISYYTNGYELKYAQFDGTRWLRTLIDGGEAGWSNSIAIDSKNLAHIAYTYPDPSYQAIILKYAYDKEVGGWSKLVVDNDGSLGFYCAIAIDINDDPHISYMKVKESWEANNLKYAHRQGFGEWDIATIDSIGNVGWYSSIALDLEENPHITYSGNNELKYASWDGTDWNIEIIANINVNEVGSSLAFDSQGRPLVAFVSPHSIGEDFTMVLATGSPTAIRDNAPPINQFFSTSFLGQNYPNPFNPSTTIPFTISGGKKAKHARLSLYDLRGRLIKEFLDKEKLPGSYKIFWDGKNDRGNNVSNGIYLCVMKVEGERDKIKKLLLIK